MIRRSHYTVTSVAGRLCIACSDSMQDEPLIRTLYWPTNQSAAQFAESIGKHGRDWVYDADLGRGVFRVRWGGNWSIHSTTMILTDGGRTNPVFDEIKTYRCPKSRGKETRYHQGEWQRRMAKGWEWLGDESQFVARPKITMEEAFAWRELNQGIAA